MSESFDEFQPAPNEWDEFQPANPGPSTRDVLKAVSSIDPAQASKASKLAKKYNAADEVLLRTLQDAEMVDRINTATTKLDKAPVLADYMRNSLFVAAQAQKDIDPLVKMNEQMRAPRTALGTLGDVGVTALKGVVGLPQSLVGLVDIPTLGGFGKDLETLGVRFKDTQNFLSSLYSPAQQQANQAVSEADGFVGTLGAMLQNPSTIATTVGQSAPQMLGGAAIGRGLVAVAPRVAPWLSAALGEGIISAGGAAEQTREQTDDGRLSVKQSLSAVASGGGTALFGAVGGKVSQRLGLADIDTALVARGVDKTSAQAAKTGFIAAVTKAGVSEGVFEELPQSVQEQMWQNYANDRPINEGVGAAAAQGLLAGLSMGSGFQVLAEGGQRIAARAQQADAAAQDAAKLQNLMASAAEATLRQNNPETFAQLVQHMADNTEGAPKSVYIDAQVFNQAVQTLTPEQLAQAFPSVTPEQIAEAVTTNSTVEVPIGEALAAVPGTPLEQVFLQNARSAPDALSLADAQTQGEQAAEWIKTEAERVLQQAQDQTTWQTSSEGVRTTILDQLNQAGRFTPEVNEAYALLQANFFSTMAARLGITPQEMYDRYALKVAAGAQQATAGNLEQGTEQPRDLIVAHNLTAENFRAALEMGGLPAPSLAITKVDAPIEGFGEITLVGDTKLATPSAKNPVFDADVYSPRFPDVKVKVDEKVVKAALQPLMDAAKAAGLPARRPDSVIAEMGRNRIGNAISDLSYDNGMRLGYANAVLGKNLTAPTKEVAPQPVAKAGARLTEQSPLKELLPTLNVGELTPDTAGDLGQKVYAALVNKTLADLEAEGKGSPSERFEMGMELVNRRIRLFAETEIEQGSKEFEPDKVGKMTSKGLYSLYNLVRSTPKTETEETAGARTEVDTEALNNLLDAEAPVDDFKAWVREQLRPAMGERRVVTESGRTTAFTLDNIVKAMTRKVRDAEGFNYGLGNARSKGATKFKNLKQIQGQRDRVVGKDAFDAARKEIDAEFSDLAKAVTPFQQYERDSAFELLAEAIGNSYSMPLAKALEDATLINVPTDLQARIAEFAGALVGAPTEYFEAKPQRAVGFNEFRGAVVPADTPADVRELLTAQGLQLVEYRKGDEQSRAQAARQLAEALNAERGDVLFQQARGTFNPQSLLITLNENANLSTFLHESGHFFLEVMADLASQPNAPAQVREDMDKLLAWFGIKGDENVGGPDAGGSLAQMLPDFAAMQAKVDQQRELTAKRPEGSPLRAVGERALQRLESELQAERAKYANVLAKLEGTKITDQRGNPLVVYHGGGTAIADTGKFKRKEGGRAVWFSDTQVAETYAGNAEGSTLYPVYLDAKNPLEFDAAGATWQELEFEGKRLSTDDLADIAEQRGHDVLIIRNLRDANTDDGGQDAADHFAVFKPEQIVSALTGGVLAQDGNLPTDNTQPAGRTPLETWNAMTLDQKRPYHEKFAESFEAYLLEGKAPSQELQPLFRRFRSWLVNVYKSLKDFMRGRDLNMNDEVRQVFDRMLATDEQIAQAEETAGMLPDFDATNEAIEKLQARSLRDLKWTVGARSRALKALQKEAANLRKAVEAEVRAEVDDMPVYQAQAAIDRIKGEPSTEQLETIAEATGFTSASEMLTAIGKADTKAAMIEGMTDQRMLENFGELATPQAIEEAANDAVHNEARARALATELKGQADALNPRQQTGTDRNGRPVTVNALVAAAKQFAENITARRKVKDLKKAAAQHRAAEARAGKAWQEATAKGKTQEAVQAKRDQLLNNYAAKSMQEADAEITKVIDYFKKFDKDTIRKNIPSSYLDQIDALLENMDLRKSVSRTELERRASLRKWVESQQAIGLDPIVPDELMENAQRVSYKEMTVDELRSMRDVIKNIEHLGRLKSKLLAAKDKREFDAAVDAWAKEIRDNGGKPLPVKLEGDSRPVKMFKSAWADHRKLNSLIRQFAANADNSEGFKLLIRSMNERGTQEDVMIEKASVRLAEIHAPIEKLPGGFSGAKLFIPEINNSLTRAGRLAVALNWGNEQNRQRVRDGDNWTNEQVDAILRTLTPVELKFVNDVWEYLDSYWPEIKAKQERVSGVVEDKVQADPFTVTLADGTEVQMRGGYYPIKYDGDRSLKSQKQEAEQIAKDMLRGAMLRPATRRGHTKARVDEVIGRPVKKDLSVITQHVTQVVHDLAWHEWAIDANRLMNDPRIASAIRDYYGAETHRAMTDAIEAIVVGDVAKQTSIDQLLLMMRANVTRSIMGASLTTALLQPFGLTQSMARIGVTPVLKGAGRWAGDALRMESTVKWVGEKSDFMRLRSKTFNRELREISQRVRGKSKIAQVADASLFMLMQKMQLVADIPTWVGAYEKALNSGAEEATAVQLADEAVLSSQGGGNTRDLAAVQRDHPFLTQFYSYFNTTLQLVTESTAATDFKNPRAVAGWLGDMMLLAVVPAILPALITFSLKGGGEDDEPEEWAKRLVEWQAGYMLGMFVGLRELPALWSPFDYGGPPAAKLINDGRRLVQQANQGEIDEPAVLATIGFLGTALGIPTTQIVRSYKGWKAWDEGDAPASSILFGPPPKD